MGCRSNCTWVPVSPDEVLRSARGVCVCEVASSQQLDQRLRRLRLGDTSGIVKPAAIISTSRVFLCHRVTRDVNRVRRWIQESDGTTITVVSSSVSTVCCDIE